MFIRLPNELLVASFLYCFRKKFMQSAQKKRLNSFQSITPLLLSQLASMHNAEWVCCDQLANELDRVPAYVAALILQTLRRELCGELSTLWKFLFKVTDSQMGSEAPGTS